MFEKNQFANYIISKRKKAGLTQKELAERLYVTNTAVSKWERGVSYPDVTLIKPICEALGITPQEFIDASDDTTSRKTKIESKYYKKIALIYHILTLGSYALAILVCLVCNLIIDKTLSWSLIVLASIILAFTITNLPFASRHINVKEETFSIVKYVAPLLALFILLFVVGVFNSLSWLITAYLGILLGYILVFLPLILRKINYTEGYRFIITSVAFFIVVELLYLNLCMASGNDWFFFASALTFVGYTIIVLPIIFSTISKFTKKYNLLLSIGAVLLAMLLFLIVNNYYPL